MENNGLPRPSRGIHRQQLARQSRAETHAAYLVVTNALMEFGGWKLHSHGQAAGLLAGISGSEGMASHEYT